MTKQEGRISQLFSQIPSKQLQAWGPSGSVDLLDYFSNHGDAVPEIFRSDLASFLRALLYPSSERVKGVSEKDRGVLRVYGARHLWELANRVSTRRPSEKESLQLNLGVGTDGSPLSPAFPAYLELGIQRVDELVSAGFDARLRIFSTASLSTPFFSDEASGKESQRLQAAMAEAYLNRYHSHLMESGRVDLADMTKAIPLLSPEKLAEIVNHIRSNVSKATLQVLETYSLKYTSTPDYGLTYAAYHCVPESFCDGALGHHVSIGGSGEDPFNECRFAVLPEAQSLRLALTRSQITCRTPPYLRRSTGSERDFHLTMSGFQDLGEDSILHGGPDGKEIRHILRCVSRKTEMTREDALSSYKTFCGDFSNHHRL